MVQPACQENQKKNCDAKEGCEDLSSSHCWSEPVKVSLFEELKAAGIPKKLAPMIRVFRLTIVCRVISPMSRRRKRTRLTWSVPGRSRFIMVMIASKAGLAMAKSMVRAADKADSLIIGDKMVSKAIENTAPVILLIAANDGSCVAHVAYATENNIPVIVLPSREDVGEFIGGSRKLVVCCAVDSFVGHEEMLARLLLLG